MQYRRYNKIKPGDNTAIDVQPIADEENCGRIVFETGLITAPDTYRFTVSERETMPTGWALTSGNDQEVVLTVTKNPVTGVLSAEQDVIPEIVNTFTPAETIPTRFEITACKIGIGADVPAGEFTFDLIDGEDTVIDTATNGAAHETVGPDADELLSLVKAQRKANHAVRKGVTRYAAAPDHHAAIARAIAQLRHYAY
ncbi:MAG: hypothetical protein LBD16_02880 [Oscillospiraceae bacterium]|jgi:hypothetical protein|nr:hypothetical protein [Oscillospiraceae bacterium]